MSNSTEVMKSKLLDSLNCKTLLKKFQLPNLSQPYPNSQTILMNTSGIRGKALLIFVIVRDSIKCLSISFMQYFDQFLKCHNLTYCDIITQVPFAEHYIYTNIQKKLCKNPAIVVVWLNSSVFCIISFLPCQSLSYYFYCFDVD